MVRRYAITLLLVLGQALLARAALADTQISIDRIEANREIAGTVRGATPAAAYKVLVYVHTDKWYIHPWANRGEGQSWAAIGEDGKWRIATVRREFKADKIAGLVVKRNAPEPSTLFELPRGSYEAGVIKTLTGTEDEGKL